jgi:hypothetical protein
MQLELFCAEDTVRAYQQRMDAHAEREHVAKQLISTPRTHPKPSRRVSLPSWSEALARRVSRVWCAMLPARLSPCPSLS